MRCFSTNNNVIKYFGTNCGVSFIFTLIVALNHFQTLYSKTSWDTDKCPKNIQCISKQCILRYMAVKYCVKVLQNQCTARLTLCSKSTVYLKYYGIQCTSMEPSCYSRSILHQTPIFPEFFQLPTFHVVVKTNSRKNEKGFLKNQCNSLSQPNMIRILKF